jgi:tRNA U54 and U55 pseudouridine synthase Pus10
METTITLAEFGEKYQICNHCLLFLTKPDDIVKNFSEFEKNPPNIDLNKEDFTIKDFIGDSQCILCLGIWSLLNQRQFYEKMLQKIAESEYEYKTIQMIIKFPLTLKLRYILYYPYL